MPADLAPRRRRPTGAAVVRAIGARLVTAGSAVAAAPSPSPDNVAVSPPPPSQPTRANGNTKHTTRAVTLRTTDDPLTANDSWAQP